MAEWGRQLLDAVVSRATDLSSAGLIRRQTTTVAQNPSIVQSPSIVPTSSIAQTPSIAQNTSSMAMTTAMSMTQSMTQAQAQPDPSKTKQIFGNLILQSVQNVRYMHVGIGTASMVLALIIIIRIFYDSWRASKLQISVHPKRFSWVTDLHPAEVFPLILSVTTIIQQTILIIALSPALKSVTVTGCENSVQIVFPAIFILGYVHYVVGAEYTVRAFQSKVFSPRKPWTTRICLAVLGLMLIFTWLPTNIIKSPDRCFGDIVFRPLRYSSIALAILSLMIVSFMIMAVIIGMKLVRVVNIDPNERIAASRVFYYLIAAIIVHVLILPYYIQVVLRDFTGAFSSSRVAEFGLFGSGIIVSLIHIFLRANALRTAIKPVQAAWSPRRKFRLFGPSDLEIVNISPPVNLLGPREAEYYWKDSEKLLDFKYAEEKSPFQADNLYTIPHKNADQGTWPLSAESVTTPKPAIAGFSALPSSPAKGITSNHKRNQSNYSLFPTAAPAEDGPRLPPAVYSPPSSAMEKTKFSDLPPPAEEPSKDSLPLLQPTTYVPADSRKAELTDSIFLQPPNPDFAMNNDRRESNASSTGTVQIGLRLSMAPSATVAAPSTASFIAPAVPMPSKLRVAMTPPVEESERLSMAFPSAAEKLESPTRLLQQRRLTRQAPSAPPSQPAPQAPPKPSGTNYTPEVSSPLKREKALPPTPRRGISGLHLNPVSPKRSPTDGFDSGSPLTKVQSPGPGFF